MNSRERVTAALNHTQPDRVPVDFGSHRSSGIMAIAYARLKQALGISSGDIYIYDMVQQLALVELEILDLFGIDAIEMGRGFLADTSDWKEWILPDGTACKIPSYINVVKKGDHNYLQDNEGKDLAIQKKDCYYFEQVHFPLMDRDFKHDDFEDLEDILPDTMWTGIPTPGAHISLDEKGLEDLSKGAKQLYESTDRAVIGLFGGNMFEIPQFLCRLDNYFMYMGLYPEAIERLSEKLSAIHMNNLETWLGAVGPYIDIILFGDDLGGQNGPLMSVDMYRNYFKPYHRKLWNRAKELSDVKVMLHCCGGIEPLLEDLIDAGLDTVNPVQISCAGMDSQTIKEAYGDRIAFWGGGCDTRDIIIHSTPSEVKDHVRKQIDIMNINGGFVFQQVHNIMADVPAENIIAMFEAVRDTYM